MRNLKLIISTGSIKFDFVSQIVSGKQILSSDSHVTNQSTHRISFNISDAQWRDLSKFEDAKVRFIVRSEMPIDQQKDSKRPGATDNFYMKCAGGFLINWKVATEELANARQKNVSRPVQITTNSYKPVMVGMLSQFLPQELRESMQVSIDASSKIGPWTGSGASVSRALNVVNENNQAGINDLCEFVPMLHAKFGGTPFDEKQKRNLVEILGGQMIFPQQTEQGVAVWDVSGSHAQMEAIKTTAAQSRDMQWMALKTWLRAYGMNNQRKSSEAVWNALRMLSAKCDYTFDPAWSVDPVTQSVVVAPTHGENFDFYGASATPPEVVQDQVDALKKLQQRMLTETGAKKQGTLQAHNKIMNRLYSTGEDCEDIGNYICLVSSVMDADAKLDKNQFVNRYMYFSKIMSDDADTFRLYLSKLHDFIKKAWKPEYALHTGLVLAGAPNMDANQSGGSKQSAQKAYEPADTITQIQQQSAFQQIAGHCVAVQRQVVQTKMFDKKINNNVFTVSKLNDLRAMQMCEGTATTFESGDQSKANFDVKPDEAGLMPDDAQSAMSKLSGACTAMDADNRVAALLVKDMKLAPDMASKSSLSVKAAVSYGNKIDNFYKYVLSAGPHQIFHVASNTKKTQTQPQTTAGDATIVYTDDNGQNGLQHILELEDTVAKSCVASGIRFKELVNGRGHAVAVSRAIPTDERKACALLAEFNAFENMAPLSMENLGTYEGLGIRFPPLALAEKSSIDDNHNLILMRGCLTDVHASIAAGKRTASEAWAGEHAARLKFVKQYLRSRSNESDTPINVQVHTISESLWGWKIPPEMQDFHISAKVFT